MSTRIHKKENDLINKKNKLFNSKDISKWGIKN